MIALRYPSMSGQRFILPEPQFFPNTRPIQYMLVLQCIGSAGGRPLTKYTVDALSVLFITSTFIALISYFGCLVLKNARDPECRI